MYLTNVKPSSKWTVCNISGTVDVLKFLFMDGSTPHCNLVRKISDIKVLLVCPSGCILRQNMLCFDMIFVLFSHYLKKYSSIWELVCLHCLGPMACHEIFTFIYNGERQLLILLDKGKRAIY